MGDAPPDRERARRDLLLPALVVLTFFALQSLNGSPWYDGTDGLRVVVPLLALLAALGLAECGWALEAAPSPRLARFGPLALTGLAIVAMLPGRIVAGDVPGAYANGLVGGPAGVVEAGLQRRADPALEGPVRRWMAEELPAGARVAVAPDGAAFRELAYQLQSMGALRDDLYFGEPFAADFLVLIHAPERPGYTQAVLATSGRPPLARIERGGVPLAWVYALE